MTMDDQQITIGGNTEHSVRILKMSCLKQSDFTWVGTVVLRRSSTGKNFREYFYGKTMKDANDSMVKWVEDHTPEDLPF